MVEETEVTRQSLMGLGTMPEWIGLVLIIVGVVWTVSTVVNDLKHQMSLQESAFNRQAAKIVASVEKIEVSIDTQARIVRLERSAELAKFEKGLAENTGRINRLFENIDIGWNHIRENEGKIRQLREQVSTPHSHPKSKE